MIKSKPLLFTVMLALLHFTAWSSAMAGDGDNNFKVALTDSPSDMVDSNARDITTGSDLDQDGKYEIIVTDYDNGGQVHVFEVVGDNTVEWVWSSPGTPSQNWAPAREVQTGDLDNDGLGEILMSISTDDVQTDSSGIYVYEWDGVNDNGYIFVAVIPIDLSLTAGYTENFTVADIDGDNMTEAIYINNGSDEEDNCYIISITGTFETTWSQVTEATYTRSGGDFSGSPLTVVVADLDGDGSKEMILSVWEYASLFIVESSGPDTYVPGAYIQLSAVEDDVVYECMVAKDFNGDGADELFFSIYPSGQFGILTGGADVSTITYTANVSIIRDGGAGYFGMDIGDQDHGVGTDGPDIYIAYFGNEENGGYIQDFEYIGTDVMEPTSYAEHVIYQDVDILAPGGGLFQLDVPPVDLDGDGEKEVVMSYTGNPPNGIFFRVLEFNSIQPTLTLNIPNGGEIWGSDTYQEITWSSDNFIGSLKLEYSTDDGNNWNDIVSYIANDGSYNWLVPREPSDQCFVRISDVGDGDPWDVSDYHFSIFNPNIISLPDVTGAYEDTVEVAISVSTDSTIGIAQVVVEYDNTVLQYWEAQVGPSAPGFSLLTNADLPFPPSTPGTNDNLLIQVSGGGSNNFTGPDQDVALIKFVVIDPVVGNSSPLAIDQDPTHTYLTTVHLNDLKGGDIIFNNGSLEVIDKRFDISGTVTYDGFSRPVSDVTLNLTHGEGSGSMNSDGNGDYFFGDIITGDIELVPSKIGDLRDAITGSDALFVLQYLAFLVSMNEEQKFAADVTEDGNITGSDAQAILRYLAFYSDNIASTSQWSFNPANASFTLQNDAVVDFKAYLLGDANLDWGGSAALAKTGDSEKYSSASLAFGNPVKANDHFVKIPVLIENSIQEVNTLIFSFEYDSDALTYKSTSLTSLSQDFMMVANGTQPGKIHIAMAGVKGITESGKALDFMFEAKQDAKSPNVKLNVTRALINDLPAVSLASVNVDFNSLILGAPTNF